MTKRTCSEPNCKRPARGRGLCQTHYATKWKVGDLPLKERKELLVRHKLYLTRAQTMTAKRLALDKHQPMSSFFREVIAEFLKHFETD